LRAYDNPVIDAAVRLGNALQRPVLVYHGVREDYPYASDRLHRFILGASRDFGRDCRARGLACVQHVDRAGVREKGLVHRLGAAAAAIVVEDQPAFIARWQTERVAARAAVAVYAVNAACLVPPAVIGGGITSRTGFLRRHEPARSDWLESVEELPDVAAYTGPLPFVPDRLDDHSDADLDALVAGLAIDHSLPVSSEYPAGRAAAQARLERLVREVLPVYAAVRNDATQTAGARACRHICTLASSARARSWRRSARLRRGTATRPSSPTSCSAGASGSTTRRPSLPPPSATAASPAGRPRL
jgi:deoxyribodipyrimidine photolyase